MTTKAAFSPSEWQLVLEGPPTAGLLVITASHGGMFRETIAMSKAYAEARAQHGESELLDEIVAEKPGMERGKARNPEELRDQGLDCLRDVTTLLEHGKTQVKRNRFARLDGGTRTVYQRRKQCPSFFCRGQRWSAYHVTPCVLSQSSGEAMAPVVDCPVRCLVAVPD